ncbi:GNAT family N-acetyltransferase [Natrononativus amylolyticus]|uniref:GNAT family N-acetyltransferase n=1 Tax=Natrononativus amylolyticus TaxID=2963434 RepID=UPI0020CBF05A|nr:GNAT family N-acetyltransferase [Natrononativus amylolyticus]
MDHDVRPYEPTTDADALWALKREFELGLGGETGGEEKAEVYAAKLTADYEASYLEWVDRCVAEEPEAVTVAAVEEELVGYAFVLPSSLAHVWDAAVLNELYLEPAHRGSGVADDLMDAVLETAREQELPLDRIVLDVDRENDRAQAFYERHGFSHWGEMVARPLE